MKEDVATAAIGCPLTAPGWGTFPPPET